MSILEILGLTWIILMVCNFVLGLLGVTAATKAELQRQEDAAVQQAVTHIINNNTQILIEIIKFDSATIYYAYQNITRKFLAQGNSEQEVLDNLTKKYGKTQFQIVSREYVGTTY